MSKRENKRIRQLERRVEKLERILCDKHRVPDYEIQITAAGTPEMLDDMGTKLAKSIQKAFGKAASIEKPQESAPMEFKFATDKDKQAEKARKTVYEVLKDRLTASSYR